MQDNMLAALPLIAPFSLMVYALIVLNRRTLSSKNGRVNGLFPTVIGMVISLVSIGVFIERGVLTSELLGWNGLGFSIRLDALSVLMLSMISILGFVILKFSSNYMDGDPRKEVFFTRLAVTIAAVEMLVLSGNLFQILFFWIMTSICLHYLLVFYRHRPQAIAAARKKFIVARLGDLSLLGAVVLLYQEFNTGHLDQIFSAVQAHNGTSLTVVWATVLIVLAGVLKSAQFPSHGWLIEVVETPTPVSALLHAGLLNAGPFLMVRLSFLMVDSTVASVLLMGIGGVTALFASVVYLTQPSIKISLGYSSIAHMGFSLMLCGLGVYSAAILHIVGHSFYKAHSFLSSGSAVDALKMKKIKQYKRLGSPVRILSSIAVAVTIFMGSAYLFGMNLSEDFHLVVIGTIIVMGLSQFLTQAIDTKGHVWVLMQSVLIAVFVSFSFLILEHGARLLLQEEIPALAVPNVYVQVTALVLLSSFVIVSIFQLVSPKLTGDGFGYRLGVHLRNGLYANVLFDRLIGSLKHEKFKWVNLNVSEEPLSSTLKAPNRRVQTQEPDLLLNI